MDFRLEGVFPAMVTPFSHQGAQVDYDKAGELANFLADKGVTGVFVAGTTGEGPLLTLDERKRLAETVIAAAGKRIKVLVHSGTFDTASTIDLTLHAQEAGAYCVGAIAPGYFSYDDDALIAHFRALSEAAPDFPIMLYNIPGCVKNVLSPDVILRLADLPNIVGIKDSSGAMANLSYVLAGAPAGFNVINGVDEYSYQALLAGAKGMVSSTANVVPELFLEIFTQLKKNDDRPAAWKAQTQLLKACKTFQYGRMVAYYKEGLRLRGFDPGTVRAPQRELTDTERTELAENLERLGLI